MVCKNKTSGCQGQENEESSSSDSGEDEMFEDEEDSIDAIKNKLKEKFSNGTASRAQSKATKAPPSKGPSFTGKENVAKTLTTSVARASPQLKSKLSAFASPGAGGASSSPASLGESNFPHCKYSWLQKPCDAAKRRPGDEGYDPTTLHLPDNFLAQQTPAQHQWWKLKSAHFDTVLFFKMGKFYELFHMDAVLAVGK